MWSNEQQSRLPFGQLAIASQEWRLLNFDIVKPLLKSNGDRVGETNFVFGVAGSVVFASGYLAMAWSKVSYRAS